MLFFYEKVLVSFSNFVIVLINWEQDFVLFNSVCKHTRYKIRLLLRGRPILLITYMITDWTGLYSLYFITWTRDKIHTLLYKNLSGNYHNASFCDVSLITYHSLQSLTSCTYKHLDNLTFFIAFDTGDHVLIHYHTFNCCILPLL